MSKTITKRRPECPADPAKLQALVASRLAARFGLSAPVAAVLAHLAGIGPEARRAAR